MEPAPAGAVAVDAAFPSLRDLAVTVTEAAGGVEIIDRIAPAWRELCVDSASCDQPFYRPEFLRAYVLAFAPRNRIVLLTASIGGRLKAVLPLVSRIGWFCGLPARQLQGTSNAHSCRFDMVRVAGPEGDAAVDAIWAHLRKSRNWDIILLTLVPENASARRLATSAQADCHRVKEWEYCTYPYVTLTGEGDEPWMKSLSAQFRGVVRRRSRQLESAGGLRLIRVDQPDPELLQAFYDLEAAGWKGEQGTAIACHANTRKFYDEIAREAGRHGYFSLYLLYFNDAVMAASFGFDFQGRHLYLKTCHDETYRKNSPGHVHIYKVLLDCKQRGLTEFDFAGQAEEYKLAWTSQVRPIYQYCIFQNSIYGRFLYWVRARAARIKHLTRSQAGQAGSGTKSTSD